MEILQNLFRTLMFALDNIVYSLIPIIYKLFIYLSQLNLYGDSGDNPLQSLVSHVYVLLGIFMLFKVSFSFLQYIVDPNSFRDSSKGIGKLITNVLVALVLLVSVPSIFNMATVLQTKIIQTNAIGQLILGTSASGITSVTSDGKITGNGAQEMATDLQFMLYGAFYSINPKVIDDMFPKCSGTSGVLGSTDMAVKDGCLVELDNAISEYDDASSNGVSLYSFFKYAGDASDISGESCQNGVCDDRDFSHFDKLLWWKDDGEYVINYLPVVSTIAGVYVAFLLISFSIDIAVRAIKLCFLQMVAPIAIVSYVDPKESISNGKLHNWIKECASTYFSLFLRMATIFLVMLLVSTITSSVLADGTISSQIPSDDIGYKIWIYLFLVIGAFMFAKQVPNIIESIFGIKNSGNLNLNPFKTFASARDSGFGAAVGLPLGFGVGAVASGIAAGKTSIDSGENKLTAFRRSLGGALSGGLKGGLSSAAGGGKGIFKKSFNAAGDISRSTAMKANTKLPYRVGAYVRNAIGAQSLKETLDQKASVFENYEKSASNIEARARDQLSKKYDPWKLIQGQRARNEEQFAKGEITEETYKKNLNDFYQQEKGYIKQYVNNNGIMPDSILDSEDLDLVVEKQNFARNVQENGLEGLDDLENNSDLKNSVYANSKNEGDAKNIQWDEIDSIKKAGHNEAIKIKNSNEYEDATNAEKAKLSDLRQSFLNK